MVQKIYQITTVFLTFWLSSLKCTYVDCNVAEVEQSDPPLVLSRPQWQALEQLTEQLTQYDDAVIGSEHKRGANEVGSGVAGGMWFGPRLGKRSKRQNVVGGSGSTLIHDSGSSREQHMEEVATIIDLLQDQPWAIVALTGGRRYTMNFTPRLGRQNDEPFGGAEGPMSDRIPPFAPRLGRKLNTPFSPRLGREMLYESLSGNYLAQPRYIRSVKNKDLHKRSS